MSLYLLVLFFSIIIVLNVYGSQSQSLNFPALVSGLFGNLTHKTSSFLENATKASCLLILRHWSQTLVLLIRISSVLVNMEIARPHLQSLCFRRC